MSQNRLRYETSAYLRQHADNPVNWYPWCQDAIDTAKSENKLIFLSIGYSTCHWCHVMEKEVFQDEDVAELLNENFISIKVDREERPDVDHLYMTYCQQATGSGGWPLNVFLTPDKLPFHAETYLPKFTQKNKPGIMDLLTHIIELWESEPNKINESATKVSTYLQNIYTLKPDKEINDITSLLFNKLKQNFDNENGGFSEPPKFPSPHQITFLLRYFSQTKNNHALYMAEKTLLAIRSGGVYDQVGFGLHRYSTDKNWFVPHFEKMLYDQAFYLMAIADAYQCTHNPLYHDIALEILEYINVNMTAEEDLLYAAEDADSDGIEGKFYTWSSKEINNLLNQDQQKEFIKIFGEPKENWQINSKQKVHLLNQIHHFKNQNLNLSDLKENQVRKLLLQHRDKRNRPFKDKKHITAWNALMIVAFAKAAMAFSNDAFREKAISIYEGLQKYSETKGQLKRLALKSVENNHAFAEDYATLTWACIELHQLTFDEKYFLKAEEYLNICLAKYADQETGLLNHNQKSFNHLPINCFEIYDGAIPAANSIHALNLIRMHFLSTKMEYLDEFKRMIQSIIQHVKEHPLGFSFLMQSIQCYFTSFQKIEFQCTEDKNVLLDYDKHLAEIRNLFLPFLMITTNRGDKNQIVYCKDFSCQPPINNYQEFIDKILTLWKS